MEYRAFLSHSSRDKDFVRAIVRQLGRPFVRVDYQEFSAGVDFIGAIEEAIENSGLFVLFATKHSLESMWVGFEAREAQFGSMFGRLPAPIVYIIDRTVRASDLPQWMQRAKIVEATSPGLLAADLRGHIDDLVRERQNTVFVGRSREIAALEDVLAPDDGTNPATLFAVTGLRGIGRRTLLTRVTRDLLSFRRTLEIEVESGDSIKDIASKVADQVEPVGGPQQSIDRFVEIQQGSDAQAIERMLVNFRSAIAMSFLPLLVDEGGLLRNDARFAPPVQWLLQEAEGDSEMYVAVVATRRPLGGNLVEQPDFPCVQVRPLDEREMRRLISSVARHLDISLAPRQIADLATQCRGYPPSARYALELVRQYGAPAILANTERLVQFRASPMLRYIREVAKQPVHQELLRVLASNSPLPIEVLVDFAPSDEVGVAEALLELIDLALVVPDSDDWYRISSPVTEAVRREFRDPTAATFQAVADRLKVFLRNAGPGVRYAELERVRYRALAMTGTFNANQSAMSMAADWIRLAERLYHDRAYEQSIDFARLAVEARPDNEDSHRWLISSLIKTGEFSEASEAIDEMRMQGMRREALYLEGFLERHRYDHGRAAELYEEAAEAGYSGVALHRELASCYLEMGDVDRARREIEAAQRRSRDNRFIVDLLIRIACQQGDEETAMDLLAVLEEVDDEHFVAHRRSRVEVSFGRYDEAYRWARKATVDGPRSSSHEALCNLAFCCIRTKRYDEASRTLNDLDRVFPRRSLDVRTGLRCRLAIATHHYDEALSIWNGLDDKSRPVHLTLRRDALRGVLQATALSDERFEQLKAEVALVEGDLASVPDADRLTELGSA